ncbi:MAG TPA: hypothetical protein VFK89_11985 [Actinomycetota bacterium]|nr:hypothetical protein [Actinomycetota bacterium]
MLLAFVGGIVVSAATASNRVIKSNVGQGSGSIGGYTISSSTYTLDSNDARIISNVTFTLDAAQPAGVRTVRAKVTNGSYQTCTTTGGTTSTSTWSCTLNSNVTAAGTTLSVVGAQ